VNVSLKCYHAAKHAFRRCTLRRHEKWDNYGGRGIRVLFADVRSFAEHLMTLPGHDDPERMLDRVDVDGHYAPDNVRWATRSESQRNRRRAPLPALGGVSA
jgi:hypothetical protein